MKKLFLLVFVLVFISFGYAQNESKPEENTTKIFDETRDPVQDLSDAVEIAQKENKTILMKVGGNWCIWCKRLYKIFSENEEISQLLEKHYVLLKVNYSKECKNEEFLSNYPKIVGYPHLFVLNSNGELIHSQNTEELELDKGYDISKIVEFLQTWAERKE
jgi:thioredoxin-related protein